MIWRNRSAPRAAARPPRADFRTATHRRRATPVSRVACPSSCLEELCHLGNGLRLAGGDFPAGAGTKVGVGYSRGASALSTTSGVRANRPGFDTVAAYSTRGYSRVGGGLQRCERIGGAPIDLRVRGQQYEFPAGRLLRHRRRTAVEDEPHQLPAREHRGGRGAAVEAVAARSTCRAAWPTCSPKVGSGTDSRVPVDRAALRSGDDSRPRRAARLPAQRRVRWRSTGATTRCTRTPAAATASQLSRLPRSGSGRVRLPPRGRSICSSTCRCRTAIGRSRCARRRC